MIKSVFFSLFVLIFTSCSVHKYSGPTYICRQKNPPFRNEYHVLQLDYANFFYYTHYNKSGTIHDEVNGEYKIVHDTLLLKITKPIDFKTKETFVKYSDYKSQDSVYFMFFELFPQVLEINRHRYQKASLSIFYDCPTDTCPSYQAIESKVVTRQFFKDTVQVSKKYYANNHIDTLSFFDPNDELIDKKVPITIDKFNCLKIYLAIKPNYELFEIPTTMFFEKKNILSFDSKGNKMVFRPYHNNNLFDYQE